MADILTLESARDYVARQMSESYKVEVQSVVVMEERGLEFARVSGVYDDERAPFVWDVWIENGKLYGEW